jgi:hypothetical protein
MQKGLRIFSSYIAVTLVIFVFVGCAQMTIEQNMNENIGKKFSEVKRVPDSWFHRENIDENKFEMQMLNPNDNCSIAYVVRSSDDVVIDWHFMENIPRGDCDKFHTGA